MKHTGKKLWAVFGGIIVLTGIVLFMEGRQQEAASIGIIGGADGPTAIYVSGKIWPSVGSYIVLAALAAAAVFFCLKVRSEKKNRERK
ncbi:sodium ion-translocating decarboxylase subunit beta [Sinanaerobacter chloroacetimidivorans]|uniref:Sodium ion-translocating decarboxylase subunit beta n=1 Tax=Sinanaerobacter chloroacetimidivorans TaxID=2818044 RepID=A0A8J8B179_9FIRM|nr:sodium ion-translocating decarboxylase subunit beta [Sinanaerobacter chloroacetimidivorans]MBR0597969.1 sodium ion-translocating decarboxylase subunit beta [Sinanaerobacter chloroacetimidivorans]